MKNVLHVTIVTAALVLGSVAAQAGSYIGSPNIGLDSYPVWAQIALDGATNGR